MEHGHVVAHRGVCPSTRYQVYDHGAYYRSFREPCNRWFHKR